MKNSFKAILCVQLVLFAFVNCGAQKIDLKGYQSKYPGEPRIALSHKNEVMVGFVKDHLQVRMNVHEETLCLNKNAMMQADESVSYSSYYELLSLTAQTLAPARFGHKTTEIKEFDTVDYNNPSIFYDDVKLIKFSFPKLDEGVKTLLHYTYNITEPRHLGAFYFDNTTPTETAEYTITFPKNVRIGYRLFNCDSINVEFTEKQNGDKVTYSWKAKNIPRLHLEERSPAFGYYAAHMFVYIKGYTLNGIDVKVLSDVSDLYRWYHNLIEPINKENDPSLKAFVDSLVYNTSGELEKVRKIYFWVQDHIKYIAFEAGRGGFVPRNADLVYNRRFGDCKDMSSLIHKMLEHAGIPSYLTWIGTRHLPYNYEQLPIPGVDNHMIVTYKAGGLYYFLDATTGPHPFAYPSYGIQGKEAIFGNGNGKYEIVKVPEVAAELNSHTDTIWIKLDGKKITGSSSSYFRGYSRFEMYNRVANKDKTELTTFLKNYFEKGNNKFLVDNFELKNLDERDKDLVISYQFNVSNYAQIVGDEIFINLNMDKTDLGDVLKATRKVPLESNYKKQIVNNLVLEIPKGYKLSYMPGNSEFKNELFGFTVNYRSDPGHVYLTHQISLNFLLLEPSQFKQWNTMLEAIKAAYKTSIILKKDQ